MKTKKIIAFFLCIVLFVSIFAGCTDPKVVTTEDVYNVLDHGLTADGKTDVSAALLSLIEEAEKTGGTLVFPKGTYYVEAGEIAISQNIGITLLDGASFKLNDGTAFNVATGAFSAPKAQIFAGNGVISGFVNVPNVYSEWFGAKVNDGKDDSDAVQKAVSTGGKVTFLEGKYNIDKSVVLGNIAGGVVDIYGAGANKTELIFGNNIIGFDAHSNGMTLAKFNAYGIAFCEKDNAKTSTAIKISNPAITARNCHFEGLKTGAWFDHAGGHFSNNTANDCEVVYEISDFSMYIYFSKCEAVKCGTLIKAIVSPSGGYSNGILIQNCKSVDAFAEDIYLTENQAVWIADCEFIGGTGGIASVYFKSNTDSGIENCVISSAKGSDRVGIYYDASFYCSIQENTISDCSEAIRLSGGGAMTVTDNVISGSSKCELAIRSQYNIFVARNLFKSELEKPIVSEKVNKKINIIENTFAAAEHDIAAGFSGKNITAEDNIFGYSFN